MERIVEMFDMNYAMLIYEEKSGVIYTNQVGGWRCCHPQIEGVLIPMGRDTLINEFFIRMNGKEEKFECVLSSLTERLMEVTLDYTSLTELQADVIDNIFQNFYETKFIKVDRARLNGSMEAWIYVIIETAKDVKYKNFSPGKGVLVWENSD